MGTGRASTLTLPRIGATGYQLEGGMEEGRLSHPDRFPKINEVSRTQEGRPKLSVVPKTNVVADTKIRTPIVDMPPIETKATGTYGRGSGQFVESAGDRTGPRIVVNKARYPGDAAGRGTSGTGGTPSAEELRTSGIEKITGNLGPAANEAVYHRTFWNKIGGWLRGERGGSGYWGQKSQAFRRMLQKGYESGKWGRGVVVLMAIGIVGVIAWKIWQYKSIPKDQRTPEDLSLIHI